MLLLRMNILFEWLLLLMLLLLLLLLRGLVRLLLPSIALRWPGFDCPLLRIDTGRALSGAF